MSVNIGAAYIRVSSDDQLEYSPDSQLKAIRDYAKREGYIIPDEYVYQDDGISGKSASKRPAFRLMIATAKEDNPIFDTIFVWKYSRFARNQEEAIMYKNLLRKKGITVKSISEPSSDSPFASLIERIIEWMDEYYIINLSDEVRRGMREKATRGEAMGTAPYGYTVKDKSFVPDDNAEVVKYIFSQFAAGKGARALAQELGEKGVKTRRGNMPDNRWVTYILGNPVYIGKVRWSTEGHANYSRANYQAGNVMIVDGTHPPIIDLETWEQVQSRLAMRNTEVRYKRKKTGVYMLKGIVKCGDCGATLTRISTLAPSLQCHKYARGQCHVSHSITIDKANKAIIAALEQLAKSQAFVFAPQAPEKSNVSREWDRLIAVEEAKLKRARSAYLDGVFTAEEYKDAKREIEGNITRLQDGKAAEDCKEDPPDPEIYRQKVLDVLEIVRSQDTNEEAKNLALRSIIDRVVFHKPSGTFDFYLTR